jgi:hypothetical protein
MFVKGNQRKNIIIYEYLLYDTKHLKNIVSFNA